MIWTQRKLAIGSMLVVVALFLAWHVTPALAADETLRVTSSSITSEFPRGFSIKLQATGDTEIASVAVRLTIGQNTHGAYNYLDLTRGRVVDGELFWRTDTANRYVPPGTVITYRFEIEDATGSRHETKPQQFIYRDPRFDWKEVAEGQVIVAYHGPVRSRAQNVLEIMNETIDKRASVLGPDTGEPIRVTIYNSRREMLPALPPGSQTIKRELVTLGQASAEFGTVLLLGGSNGVGGTAAHEVTHILVHRAGDGVFRNVPLWLNEGLAEYANFAPASQFDRALRHAVEEGRLLPSFLRSYPGTSGDIITFYGQSRSMVRFMIERFGAEKMRRLIAALKSGKSPAKGVEHAYGFDLAALDNAWRESVGAPTLLTSQRARSRPTPVPMRPLQPYSLTPQPNAEVVGDTAAGRASDPSPEAEPVERLTATDVASAALPAFVAGDDTAEEPGRDAETKASGSPVKAGDIAPRNGGLISLYVAAVGLLLGRTGLGLRKRLQN